MKAANLVIPFIAIAAIAYFFKDKIDIFASQLKANIHSFALDSKKTNIQQVAFTLKYRIINPTDTAITISSIIGSVFISGKEFVYDMLMPVTVPASTDKYITINILIPAITAGAIVASILDGVRTNQPVMADIKGTINFPQGNINVTDSLKLV